MSWVGFMNLRVGLGWMHREKWTHVQVSVVQAILSLKSNDGRLQGDGYEELYGNATSRITVKSEVIIT
jgi:hypothetical protein